MAGISERRCKQSSPMQTDLLPSKKKPPKRKVAPAAPRAPPPPLNPFRKVPLQPHPISILRHGRAEAERARSSNDSISPSKSGTRTKKGGAGCSCREDSTQGSIDVGDPRGHSGSSLCHASPVGVVAWNLPLWILSLSLSLSKKKRIFRPVSPRSREVPWAGLDSLHGAEHIGMRDHLEY